MLAFNELPLPKNNSLEKVTSFAPESQSLDTVARIMKK
jgi:hypothetical protein